MPISRAVADTVVGETPQLAAIVVWVRRVPVSSGAIEVVISGDSLRAMAGPLDPSHEFGDGKVEALRQDVDRVQARLLRSVLKGMEECSIEPRVFRQIGKRPPLLLT
jgi:hypothetical protein